MNTQKKIVLTAIMFGLLCTHSLANAHNRFNFGLHMGPYYPGAYGYGYPHFGYYDPFFYPPAYAYPPVVMPIAPPIVVPSTPPVYIEKETTAPVQQPMNYWYYCNNPEGYYPYVKQCPNGWTKVPPQPQ